MEEYTGGRRVEGICSSHHPNQPETVICQIFETTLERSDVLRCLLHRYENEEAFHAAEDAYDVDDRLDYKYRGPFNRVDPCVQDQDEGKGIKVQVTQEAKTA